MEQKDQDSAVHRLFNLQNIKFGNPLKKFHKSLKRNHLSPENFYYRYVASSGISVSDIVPDGWDSNCHLFLSGLSCAPVWYLYLRVIRLASIFQQK